MKSVDNFFSIFSSLSREVHFTSSVVRNNMPEIYPLLAASTASSAVWIPLRITGKCESYFMITSFPQSQPGIMNVDKY